MKETPTDFAILGGTPSFTQPKHVGTPNVGNREVIHQRLDDILDTKWLTNDGRYVQEFEAEVRAKTGAKHCIALCNGTIALEVAIRALDLQGEVLVPSFTFIATAHALLWQGITPIFCDIDPDTLTIDPDDAEGRITTKTSAILGVHLWGRICDIDRIERIASQYRLKILFDAAHSFGCAIDGQRVGRFGDAEVFSFHATKFVNSFEGGAVTTDDDELARKMRLMRNFGFDGYDNVVYAGTNGKMTEMSAAMGLASIESMNDFISINRRNHDEYRKNLASLEGIRLLVYDKAESSNCQYIVILIDHDAAGISRDTLQKILWAENVRARRYFWPGCHRMPIYRDRVSTIAQRLPVTENIADQVLVLPTGTAVTEEDVECICGIITSAVKHSKELSQLIYATPAEVKTV